MQINVLAVFLLAVAGAHGASADKKDNTIQKVVDLLKETLEDSKAEGKAEENMYWKFKCYCEKNIAEKQGSIADFTRRIGLLKAKIEELVAVQGKTIITITQIKADITETKAAIDDAEANRKDAEETFAQEEDDMVASIEQMEKAVKVLERLSGLSDLQVTRASGKSNFMASKGLLSAASQTEMHTELSQAMTLAAPYITPKQKQQIESLLQAFKRGDADRWQAKGIIDMMKKLLDAFKENLDAMRKAEKEAADAYELFHGTKATTQDDLETDLEDKEASLGHKDEDLAAKREQLADMEKTKAEDEDFLAKLEKSCKEKTESYAERCKIRASEEAALSGAIDILTSEGANDSFGKVASTGGDAGAASFLQVAASGTAGFEAQARRTVRALLVAAAAKASQGGRSSGARQLAKVAMLLEDGNPFKVVLDEIDKMLALIDQEGEDDAQQLDWCNAERDAQAKTIDERKSMIENLEGEIHEIDSAINDPETGLVVTINQTETSIAENYKSQETETTSRKLENMQYQKYAGSLAEAQELLSGAIAVLKKHYETLEELVQESTREEPETWDNDEKYKGQAGKGNKAVSMLEDILSDTKKEAEECHDGEREAQHAYEDSMKDLKEEEEDLMDSLSEQKETLAKKRLLLQEKQDDLAATEADKKSIEEYVESLKFKCDFITEHFDAREEARAAEEFALKKAKGLLKDTPAYKKFEEKASAAKN